MRSATTASEPRGVLGRDAVVAGAAADLMLTRVPAPSCAPTVPAASAAAGDDEVRSAGEGPAGRTRCGPHRRRARTPRRRDPARGGAWNPPAAYRARGC